MDILNSIDIIIGILRDYMNDDPFAKLILRYFSGVIILGYFTTRVRYRFNVTVPVNKLSIALSHQFITEILSNIGQLICLLKSCAPVLKNCLIPNLRIYMHNILVRPGCNYFKLFQLQPPFR